MGKFKELLKNTPQLTTQLNRQLDKLKPLMYSDKSVNRTLSYDDLDIFGRLRGITIVKDLKIPPKIRRYLDHISAASDVSLYDTLHT